jgi:hypothetical protein
MARQLLATSIALTLMLALPVAGLGDTEGTPGGTRIYALTVSQHIISFSPTAPNSLLSDVAITGLSPNESLVGIDFRPNGEQLYGVSDASRIYTINPVTGVATPVAPNFTPTVAGTSFGMDFNPTVDRIRLVSEFDQNLRLNPVTGTVASTDGTLHYATGDPNQGANPNVVAAAYTNNFPTATTTSLYVIDSDLDILALQNPPNDGTLVTVGPLLVNTTANAGFDVAATTGVAYAALTTSGEFFSRLYTINLSNGTATQIGPIAGLSQVISIAVEIDLATGADTVGVYDPAPGAWFLRNSNTPGPANLTFTYGAGGLLVPIAGDWDGDGDDTPGVYDPTTGNFFLRNSNSGGNADIIFTFGGPGVGQIPLAGDWNGDGVDTIGIYNPVTGAFFLRNSNSNGPANATFTFGPASAGFVAIAGDWNGDNVDTVGVYDPATGSFFLTNTNATGPAAAAFSFGPAGAIPVSGDYDNNNSDTVGVYVASTGAFFLTNANAAGPASIVVVFGPPNLRPLVGDWDGQ